MRLKLLVLISTALLLERDRRRLPRQAKTSVPPSRSSTSSRLNTRRTSGAWRTGDNVRQDELIEVSTDGTGEIRLRDNTQLALGPGSRLLLDEFVYKPDISGGAIVLNLVKGSFRFITGIAAKPAYVIRTPSASITVRGTIFDVYVQTSGMSWLLLIEGAIEVCNDEGRLRTARRAGQTHSHHTRRRRGQSRQVGQPAEGWPAVRGGFPVRCSPAVVRVGPRVHARRHRRGRRSGRARRRQR